MRLAPTLAALVLAVAPLSSCSTGERSVGQGDVEDQISTRLEEQVGAAPEDVSCPGDLEGEEGASMTCVVTADGEQYDVAVEVTSVDGDRAEFDIDVADTPS